MFVHCLADTQAQAFIRLKAFPNKETSSQIMEDFNHSPDSCMGSMNDTIEDLKDSMKKKYDPPCHVPAPQDKAAVVVAGIKCSAASPDHNLPKTGLAQRSLRR